mmetsp:Transcript_18720/g.32002  ORF Transcript_18720/g.32002 Transcript_18720/m.32002 type:complete len:168 (-) Transcript_18720:55-558(-)
MLVQSLEKRNQTRENTLRYCFMLFRLQTLMKAKSLEVRRNEDFLRVHSFNQRAKPPSESLHALQWQMNSTYARKVSREFATQPEEEQKQQQLELRIASFHKFKEKQILSLMCLHFRRRARFLLYFAFQNYKTQVYKLLIGDLVKRQQMAIVPALAPAPEQDPNPTDL